MAVKRESVTQPTAESVAHAGTKATGHTESPGRAKSSRRNGGTAAVPNRRLNIRKR